MHVTIVCLVSFLLVLMTAVQLYFWLYRFDTLVHAKVMTPVVSGPPVSVIICARNEAHCLKHNLPLILSQRYHPFEVIVINDGSTDDTATILASFGKTYAHLKTEETTMGKCGKKAALSLGATIATHDIFAFTDGDCKPSSDQWLASMMAPFSSGYDVALGPAPFTVKPGFVNAFSRFEGGLTYLLYGSAALLGRPFMGVGRNMVVSRQIFDRFQKVPNLYISGDDDLLINSLSASIKVWLVKNSEAFMYSESPTTFSDLVRQKRRHVSVSWQYKWRDQLRLLLYAGSLWMHYMAIFFLAALGQIGLALTLYLIRLTIVTYQSNKTMPDYTKREMRILPVLDAAFILYYPIIGILLCLNRPRRW